MHRKQRVPAEQQRRAEEQHTGHDEGAQNYNVTFVDRGIGVVLMTNSDNFEGVSRDLLRATIGDTCSPVDWMGYPRFDPNEPRDPPPSEPPPA